MSKSSSYLTEFQALKVLLPNRTSSTVLHVTSDIDFTKYHFNLSSKSFGENQQEIILESLVNIENYTDKVLGLYVQSENLHWQCINNKNRLQENPFQHCSKLVELMPKQSYHVPLVLTKDAKFYIKPKGCSLSGNSFSTKDCLYDECILWSSSLETGKDMGLRVCNIK